MKFSLIIPTKGRVEELGRAIASLLEQTGADCEIIVSDQNEDDRVAALLAERGWTARVTVVKSSHGASRARNAGIQSATGEILGFPDDDCTYPPALLEKIAAFFETHPEYGIVTGRCLADDGGNAVTRHAAEASPIRRATIYRQVIEACLWIRRDVLGGLRFDENMGTGCPTPWQADEGPDLVLRLGERGVRGYYDPALAIRHPRLDPSDPRAAERAYRYACGSGYFLRKHGYSRAFFFNFLLRASGGAAVSLLKFKPRQAEMYRARLRGLWRGWRGFPG